MPSPRKFHLVFSFVMGAMMLFFMTFVITALNLGFGPDFIAAWLRSFAIAYIVGVPTIYILAPIARKLTAKILGGAPQG